MESIKIKSVAHLSELVDDRFDDVKTTTVIYSLIEQTLFLQSWPTQGIAQHLAIAPRLQLFPIGKFDESNRKNDSPITWPLHAAYRHGAGG